MNRYRLDTGAVIDQKTGRILSDKKVVNRLNRQDRLLKIAREKHMAVVNALNEEIDNADGELKEALIRISHRRL